jgi:hypothetical protein
VQKCPLVSLNGVYAPTATADNNVYIHTSNNFKLVNDNGWFIYDIKDVLYCKNASRKYYPPTSGWVYFSEKLEEFRTSKHMTLLPAGKSPTTTAAPTSSSGSSTGTAPTPPPPPKRPSAAKSRQPGSPGVQPPSVPKDDSALDPVLPPAVSLDEEAQFHSLLASAAGADCDLKVFLKDQANDAEGTYHAALSRRPVDYAQVAALGKAMQLLQSPAAGVDVTLLDASVTVQTVQQRCIQLDASLSKRCDALLTAGDYAALEHYGRMLHYVRLLSAQLGARGLDGVSKIGATQQEISMQGADEVEEDESYLDPVFVQP